MQNLQRDASIAGRLYVAGTAEDLPDQGIRNAVAGSDAVHSPVEKVKRGGRLATPETFEAGYVGKVMKRLPKSIRKYLRMEKARIRRGTGGKEEVEKEVRELRGRYVERNFGKKGEMVK